MQAGHASPGDEVYFTHQNVPKSGKVLSAGRHGCIVDDGERQHKIKWEHLSGHKKRAPQQYKVLDHGDDGMIVQNQHGQRRFLATPPEARAERLARPPAVGGELVKAEASGVMPSLALASIRGLQQVSERLVETVASVHSVVEAVRARGESSDRSDEVRALTVRIDAMLALQGQMIEAMKVLAGTQPIIHVAVPEQAAPVVHVAVPEQAVPVVHVAVPEQAAPVVHIEPVVVPAPQITVEMPEPRRMMTEFKRDNLGNIIGAIQKDA